jgi:phosphatidylinositol alpha-mannosyltransferase
MTIMKIGLVCPYNMFEHAGGVQQLVVHLAEELTKRKHDVRIITPKPVRFNGTAPDNYILLGTSAKFNPGMATAGTWTFDINNGEAQAMLETEKFDVLHFHEPWAPILARQILAHSKAAHVGTFHANLVDSVAAKSLVNMFIPYGRGIGKKMHLLTAVSRASASVLIDKGGDEELVKNIRYIPNGIDLKLYKPAKKPIALSGPDTKTIFYVGRLERRKGVEWLIRAFAILSAEMPNAHLIIAGEGSRRNSLEQLADTLEVPNVEFVGYISDEHKRYLMGNADLVCSPAMFGESFGIVLLEAMAMGVPLIAGRNAGYTNVLSGHGRLGLVDSESTEDFANRLAVFLSNEPVRRLVRDWGLKEVKQYDYPKIADLYENSYKDAIAVLRQAKAVQTKNEKQKRKAIHRLFVRRHAG